MQQKQNDSKLVARIFKPYGPGFQQVQLSRPFIHRCWVSVSVQVTNTTTVHSEELSKNCKPTTGMFTQKFCSSTKKARIGGSDHISRVLSCLSELRFTLERICSRSDLVCPQIQPTIWPGRHFHSATSMRLCVMFVEMSSICQFYALKSPQLRREWCKMIGKGSPNGRMVFGS